MTLDERERLLELVKDRALLRGDFTLASGAKSSYFFDLKMVTLSPEGAYLIGKLVFDILKDSGVDAIGGLTLGADPIVTAAAIFSHLEGKPIPAFIVRGELKEHGTQKNIEGCLLGRNSRVAIVEDVLTKGGSDELQQMGYDFTALLHADASGEVSLD